MTKLNGWRKAFMAFLLFAATAIASPGQATFTSLGSFSGGKNGFQPSGPLVQGTDGRLYGTNLNGGSNTACNLGCGVIFSLTTSGTLTVDYIFCDHNPACTLGNYPVLGLLLAENGEFYGMTGVGGTQQSGTIYTFSPSTGVTTLYNFCTLQGGGGCLDGFNPQGGLIQGTDGNFYGTTRNGGQNSTSEGTFFKITPTGKLKTLYSFCSAGACPGGANPDAAPMQAENGNFYGTTSVGGANSGADCLPTGCGAVYEATPEGTVTTLYNFCSRTNCADGASAQGGLVQASDGNLYGGTLWGGDGGTSNKCIGNCGTVFKISPAGGLTTIYSFCSQPNCTDGIMPWTTLIVGSDGNLYGTTFEGGTSTGVCGTLSGCGTIFEMTLSGTLTTLHSFDLTDGYLPNALFQATDGNFYGTTASGGNSLNCIFGCGAAFKLSVGLPPFVRTIPTSGRTGGSMIILGSSLTGTTAVSFNGTAATFTVVSATEIKATVPAGATSGFITVTTPTGVLKSNVKFRVTE
jgi:uncharacterized repeat protein (TIGR03803 family)